MPYHRRYWYGYDKIQIESYGYGYLLIAGEVNNKQGEGLAHTTYLYLCTRSMSMIHSAICKARTAFALLHINTYLLRVVDCGPPQAMDTFRESRLHCTCP